MKIIFIANLGFCAILHSSQEICFQVIMRAEWKKGSRLRCFQVRIKDCSHETVTREACFDGSLQGLSFVTHFRLPFPLEKVCFLTLVLGMPVSWFGTPSMLLQCWSLCCVQCSKIFCCTWALGWVTLHTSKHWWKRGALLATTAQHWV